MLNLPLPTCGAFAALTLGLLLAALPGPGAAQKGAAERPEPLPLWPHGAPGALGSEPADVPTLSVYLPPAGKANGAAIVVCPGGGYGGLAEHEGHPVALWLNSLGVTAGVLKYRLGPRYHHPAPLQDAARALRTLRARAEEWHLDPHRIGILGFSAGGHLASTLSTHFDDGDPNATAPIDRVSSRPDVSILLYPVISFTTEYVHAGSRRNLLGDNPPRELMELLSNEKQVTRATPPTFLMHTAEDAGVPVENSLLYAAALRRAGVPFELHVYEKGRHGVGLATDDPALSAWPAACAAWLKGRGLLGK
jgi:acetyl esterase/lipase